MEKVKKFLSKYGAAIVFGVAFILFLGFCALPLFDFELEIGDDEFVDSLTMYWLFSNTVLMFKTKVPTLVSIQANGYLIATFVLIFISAIASIAALVLPEKLNNIKKYLVPSALLVLLTGLLMLVFAQIQATAPVSTAGEIKVKFNDVGSPFVVATVIIMTCVMIREVFANTKFTTHEIVEFGILIGLALVLDKLPIMDFNVGAGSVNLSGIPLMILAMRHGPIKGLIGSSVIFGLVSCLLDGYGFQTYPFDYLIAFAGYAFVGLFYWVFQKFVFKKDTQLHKLLNLNIAFVLGGIMVFFVRMGGSSLSSVVLYDLSFKEGLVYNLPYVGPSAGFVTAICCALSYPLMIINKRFPTKMNDLVSNTEEVKEN